MRPIMIITLIFLAVSVNVTAMEDLYLNDYGWGSDYHTDQLFNDILGEYRSFYEFQDNKLETINNEYFQEIYDETLLFDYNTDQLTKEILEEYRPFHETMESDSDVYQESDMELIDIEKLLSFSSINNEKDEFKSNIYLAMNSLENSVHGLENIPGNRSVSVKIIRSRGNDPYLGIVTEELTVGQAADLGYNKFYGVIVDRVVPNSPAGLQRILPNDIIMEIDGNKIVNKRILLSIVASYNVRDTVEMKIFRNRQEMVTDITFGTRDEEYEMESEVSERVRKPKLSVGNGGLGWIPVWYTPDSEDINSLIGDLGFPELDDRGQFLNGFGLKGNIGNGLFLGGSIVSYTQERRTRPDNQNSGIDVIRRMKYNVRYGGITLEKRVPITGKIVTSFGSMLGWGRTSLEVSQTDGNYNWDTLNNDLSDSSNNYINLSKGHIFLQPKVELYYRLNNWLAIRSEVGYIASYSYNSGWNAIDSGDDYQVKGSPETSFDGLTFTVGPWFGF